MNALVFFFATTTTTTTMIRCSRMQRASNEAEPPPAADQFPPVPIERSPNSIHLRSRRKNGATTSAKKRAISSDESVTKQFGTTIATRLSSMSSSSSNYNSARLKKQQQRRPSAVYATGASTQPNRRLEIGRSQSIGWRSLEQLHSGHANPLPLSSNGRFRKMNPTASLVGSLCIMNE